MPDYTITISDDHEAILKYRSQGGDLALYLTSKVAGMAEEYRADYERANDSELLRKLKLADQKDLDELVAKVDAAEAARVAAEEEAKAKEFVPEMEG